MKFRDINQSVDYKVVKFYDEYSLYIILIDKTT